MASEICSASSSTMIYVTDVMVVSTSTSSPLAAVTGWTAVARSKDMTHDCTFILIKFKQMSI